MRLAASSLSLFIIIACTTRATPQPPGTPSGDLTGCADDSACVALNTPCQSFTCDRKAGLCKATNAADGTSCDDGLFCTESDACTGGACTGRARDCSAAAKPCNSGVCNEATRACESAPLADGSFCSDDATCTDDVCTGGACVSTPSESKCGANEVCSPQTYPGASGCGPAPSALLVSCSGAQPKGTDATCTVTLTAGSTAIAGEAGHIECTALGEPLELFFDDFAAGALSAAWQNVTKTPGSAVQDFGAPGTPNAVLRFEAAGSINASWSAELAIPVAGLARVCVDFSVAQQAASFGEAVAWDAGFETASAPATLTRQWTFDFGVWNGSQMFETSRNVCLAVPAGSPTLRLRLTLLSNNDDNFVMVDDVRVTGLPFDYATPPLLEDTFTTLPQGAPTGPWTSVTGAPSLATSGMDTVLQAAGADVLLTKDLDTSACSVLDYEYDFGLINANMGEGLVVSVGPSGAIEQTTLDYASPNGWGTAAGTPLPWVGLKRVVHPPATTTLGFLVRSNNGSHSSRLDNVRASCASFAEPVLGQLTDAGGGTYSVLVRSTDAVSGAVSCQWRSTNDGPIAGTGRTRFTP